ncbi:MAG: hypothetical protein JEY91_04310 [Spirochaetaceae bacterium]|nr:hypothetical protein [Spirochaetaceae bacterium]
MSERKNITSNHIGFFSAIIVAFLLISYAVTLLLGLFASTNTDEPINGQLFMILEILIIIMMPAMVSLMIAVNNRTIGNLKILSQLSVAFMVLLCGITSTVHFLILILSSQLVFREQPWFSLIFEFKWPSFVYAVDIFAWDFFFPLSVLSAAFTFGGTRIENWIRTLLILSGSLALAGLIGVFIGNMQVRDIGIIGYVGIFYIVTVLLAIVFYREIPKDKVSTESRSNM